MTENSTILRNGEAVIGPLSVHPFRDIDDAISHIISDDNRIHPGFAVAINAEKIISAGRDPNILRTINSATLRYADGIGVVLVMRRKGIRSARIPGVELWESLMARAEKSQLPVYLIGATPAVIEEVITRLRKQFPNISIAGYSHGYFDDENTILENVNISTARIITVGMGSPKQEFLIQRLRSIRPDCFYMGIGGTFDVFTGNVKRAPKLFRRLGLEWFYRVISQPSRLRRQRALPIFAWRALRNQL